MSQRTTIVLLIALLLAVGFLFAYQNNWLGLGEPSAEQKKKQDDAHKADLARVNRPLLEKGPARENIVKLEFNQPGQPPIIARLDGAQWMLESPSKMKADSAVLEEWITVAGDLIVAGVYKSASKTVSAKSAGLDQPCPELILTEKSGLQTRLKIGTKKDPLAENRTYVQVNDEPTIYAVDRDVLAALTADPAKLRSKALWSASADTVRHIAVAGSKHGNFSLDQDRTTWTVTLPQRDKPPPLKAAAEASKASGLAKSLCDLSAGEWQTPTAEDRKLWGLDQPALKVTMVVSVAPPTTQPASAGATSKPAQTQPAERTLAVSFGPDLGGTRYGRIEGGDFFSLPTTALRDVEVVPADFRDKHIVPLAADDVVGVTMVGLDGSLTELVKDDSQVWRMVKPATTRADAEVVAKLLRDATDLAVTAEYPFDDNPAAKEVAPLASPRLKLTFNRSAGRPPVVLRVGPKSPTAANTLVRIDGCPSIAWLPTADIDKLFVEPMALADKTVWSLNADDIRQVTRVESADSAGRGSRTVVREGPTWQLTEPVKMAGDDNAVRALLSKFAPLKARQQTLLSAAAAKLDKPAVTLEFSVAEKLPAASQPDARTAPSPTTQADKAARDGVRVRKLALTRKDDATLYGQADGAGPVFQLEPSLYADFTAELARRTLIDPEQVAKLTASATWLAIRSPAGVVELRKTADQWTLQSDTTVKIDPAKVADAIRDLAGISVVRFVDFACKDPAALGLKQASLRVEIGWPDKPATAAGGASSAPDAAPSSLKKLTLLIYDKREADGDYAMVEGSEKVGLVNAGEKLKLHKGWEDFQRGKVAPAAPAGPAGFPPGEGPGMPFPPPGGAGN